jgi:dipeptidyl aminopeptidase/acylaminoacyl peptidase
MRILCFLSIVLAAAAQSVPVDPALQVIDATRWPAQAVVSPDGARLAWVASGIFIAPAGASTGAPVEIAPGGACEKNSLAWSPDSRQIAFLSDCAKAGQLQLSLAPAGGGPARQLTRLNGLLADPKWSPDGKRIAILFTQDLPRAAGPLDPVPPQTGVLESKIYEQRLAVVDVATGSVNQISPADLYVYEFDWSPDGAAFAATAAHGEGDNNWWIAQLYRIPASGGPVQSIYKPPVQQQLAVPRFAPDGKSIVFIGGIMSDEGSTGGEIFQVPAGGGAARNLTPGLKGSASFLMWPKQSKQLYFSEHYDGGSAISKLDPANGQVERLWQGAESINLPFEDTGVSMSDDGRMTAVVRSSWKNPPEVWAGPLGAWTAKTHANSSLQPMWGEARSLHWKSDSFQVQGWLIYPAGFDPAKKYPLVVAVHGGPASEIKPSWPKPGFNPTLLSQQGYFVLLPNPRGSYGQGEKFTLANVRDFGGGDLRDILAGVEEAVRTAPVDPQRVGITGWSYGGFMTMFAVTQTNRFRAAVAGAGLSNWQSYYGQNSIDQWMLPYFGASVYDDPAVYAKSSAIDFIKRVKTPTLIVVGERDGECPAPQSFEFWHALKTLGVKTQMVVYAGEGHMFHKPEDRKDVLLRMIAWFNRNLR